MRKTLKRQASECILSLMRQVEEDYGNEYVKAEEGSRAMKNLAEAYTLVKRGVMLPDYGREKDE